MLWHRWIAVLPILVSLLSGCKTAGGADAALKQVEFVVTADIREFSDGKHSGSDYFEGVCEGINRVGAGEFMISPGDIDPPQAIRSVLDRHMGSNYVWYPVVGNHEAETAEDMKWLREWGGNEIPGLVRRGPAGSETTTFSFDRGPVHFVVLNQYFDGKSDYKSKGDVIPALYDWLKADLQQTKKPMVLVIGHEPILAVPDMDNGRLRHEKDSLNANVENCRRFHDLLLDEKVTAYFAAHTHNASITNLSGVWQIDAGHARGKGDPGAPSTFIKVRVNEKACTVDFHRQLTSGGAYVLTRSFELPNPRL